MEWKKVEKPLKKDKVKVLWYSNSPNLPTGYAKIVREVMSRLAVNPRYECFVLGENYVGQPVHFMNFTMVGKNHNEKEIDAVKRWIDKLKPDVFITLEDGFTQYLQGFCLVNFEVPWLAYLPFDGKFSADGTDEIMRNCTKVIAMSKFTQQEIKKAKFNSDLIIHGVDLYDFRPTPLQEKHYLRKKYGFKDNQIVVINISRNSMRKMLHRYLESAYLACVENPDLVFFNHIMNYKNHDMNLEKFVSNVLKRKYGRDMIKERRIVFNEKGKDPYQNVSDNEVAEYIKMSDFSASGNSGEGSGLLSPESFACGIPTVTTSYSTGTEWITDDWNEGFKPRGLLVKCKGYQVSSYNVEHAYCDINDLKEKILWMASHPEEREKMGKEGRRFVERFCDWNLLVKQWEKVIEEVI